MIRAVIFDLDQTLLDRTSSLSAFLQWQADGMLRPDLENSSDFITRFVELDSNGRVWKDKVYEHLIEDFRLHCWTTEELLSVYMNCFCAFCVGRPGADQAVRNLSEHYALGLISNGKSPFQERNFRALGFSHLFGSTIVSEAVGMRKPDPRIFELGCSELGISSRLKLFLSEIVPSADIRGARDANLKTVFLPTELHPTCPEADIVCEHLSELPNAIKSLGEQE